MVDYFDFSDPFYDDDPMQKCSVSCDCCVSSMDVYTDDNHNTVFACTCGYGFTIPFEFSVWWTEEEILDMIDFYQEENL